MLRKILLAALVVSVFTLVLQEYASAGVNMPYDLSTRISGSGGGVELGDNNDWTGDNSFSEQISADSGVSSHGAMTFFYGTGQTAFQVENIIGGDAGVSIWSFAGDLIYSTTGIQNIGNINLDDIFDLTVGSNSVPVLSGSSLYVLKPIEVVFPDVASWGNVNTISENNSLRIMRLPYIANASAATSYIIYHDDQGGGVSIFSPRAGGTGNSIYVLDDTVYKAGQTIYCVGGNAGSSVQLEVMYSGVSYLGSAGYYWKVTGLVGTEWAIEDDDGIVGTGAYIGD